MNPRDVQVNFSKGEIGPQLYGRFDVDTWRAALKKARNVFVLKYGGVSKRPGLHLVSEVIDPAAPVRLIPFEFGLEQTYALELGHGYMAPIALGGRFLEQELTVTNITSEAQAVVTAALHAYSVGDPVFFAGALGEMAVLNGRPWRVIEVSSVNTFRINANTTGRTFSGVAGGITRTVAPPPPPAPPPVSPAPPPPPPPPVSPPPFFNPPLGPNEQIP